MMKFLTSTYTHTSKQALTESSTDTHKHTVVHKHFSVRWNLGTHKLSVGQERDAGSANYTQRKEILRLWDCPRQQRRGAGSKLPALHSTLCIFWAAFHDLPFLQVSKCASELLLASRHHQGLISYFQFHHWWLPSCLSTLVSDKKLGKHRHAKPPSELLTCLNANDLLVLYPTHSTAYPAVRVGR